MKKIDKEQTERLEKARASVAEARDLASEVFEEISEYLSDNTEAWAAKAEKAEVDDVKTSAYTDWMDSWDNLHVALEEAIDRIDDVQPSVVLPQKEAA